MTHTGLKRILLHAVAVSMVLSVLTPLGAGAAGGDDPLDIPLSYLNETYALKGDEADGAIPVPDLFMNCASKTVTLDKDTRVTGWSETGEWNEADKKDKEDAAFHFALKEPAGSAGDLAATIFDHGNNDTARSNIVGKHLLIGMDVATSSIDAGIATKGISAGVFYDSTGSATWPQLMNFAPDGTLVFDSFKSGIAYEPNRWYNVVFEMVPENSTFKVWLDGVPVVQGNGSDEITMTKKAGQNVLTGFRVLRGLIKTVSGQKGDIYMDNVFVSAGESYSGDLYKVNRDAASLGFYKDMALLNTDINAVTTDLSLPSKGGNGSAITWESSDPSVIDPSGRINRDSAMDMTATLTATIASGSYTQTKQFTITVAQKTEDLPELDEAMDALTFDAIKKDNTSADRVISDLELPASGLNDAVITWVSSDEGAVSGTGEVTRYADGSRSVRLTAVVTVGEDAGTKIFDLTVPGDYMVADPAQNFDYLRDQSSNIAAVQEPEYGFWGFRVNNPAPLDGQYITYDVRPGESFRVSATISGEPQEITFQTGDADGNLTDADVTRTGPVAFLGSAKGWYQYEYVSNQPVAEGQTTLKINMGTPASNTSCYITGVKIAAGGETTFDDMRGANVSADEILTDLSIPAGVTVMSSHPEIITETGAVIRPSEDTMVQLTAEMTNAGVSTRKVYTLVVKGEDYVNPGDDLGYRAGADAEFEDDFADFSKMYDSITQNPGGYATGIRPWENEALGLDHALSQNHVGGGGWFAYKMEGDITGFKLDGYFSKRNAVFAPDMMFEISSDGVSWTPLSQENGEVTATEKEPTVNPWYKTSYTGKDLPAGTRYLKVIFGDNSEHGLRYAVLLEKIMIYSKDDITYATESLDVANYTHGEPLDGVMSNIDLPTAYDHGTTVTWTSSNPAVLSNAGIIDQNSFKENYSIPVTLTAVISKRGFTKATKTFELVIKKDTRNFSDMDYVNYDLSKVTFESFCDQPKDYILKSIELTESPVGGSTFSWSATSPAAEVKNGFVSFTPSADEAISMDLVLTATHNGATASKKFPITVIRTYSDNLLETGAELEASSGETVNALKSRTLDSYWTSEEGDASPMIYVTYENPVTVNAGVVVERGNTLSGFKLESSKNGTDWKTLYQAGTNEVGDLGRALFQFEETEAKYFRYTFYKPADALASLYTLELYNDVFSPAEAVKETLRRLSVPRSTKTDLDLPMEGLKGTVIRWSSSNTAVIADDGTITKTTGANRSATLTATASLDGYSESRTFSPTEVINDIKPGPGGGGGGGGNSSGTGITPLPPVTKPIEPTTPPAVFSDTDGHWAHDYIFQLLEAGVVSSDSTFRPEDSVTREEFLKMLLLGANISVSGSVSIFTDVDADAWYHPYISTASQLGIVYGMGNGTFGVGTPVTREDIAVMTARVLEMQNKLTAETAELTFSDSTQISDYAVTAVGQLTRMQILNGNEDNTFAPAANATRAEAAKIICVMNGVLAQQ